MNRKILNAALSATLILVFLLMIALTGCSGGSEQQAEPVQPANTTAATDPAQQPEPSEPAADTGRKDGDRFEEVIMIEGTEETVKYEHVRNEAIGFELDYDYESLERNSGSDRERFVSVYDDPNDPDNYLEVMYDTADADTVTAAISAALSLDFDKVENEPFELDNAGWCVKVSASESKGEDERPGALTTAYVIPAADGCRVAKIHCTVESAEGFGARFSEIMNTFKAIDKK